MQNPTKTVIIALISLGSLTLARPDISHLSLPQLNPNFNYQSM